MYQILLSHRAEKALKTLLRAGFIKKERIGEISRLLQEGVKMPLSYQDHALQGNLMGLRECHLAFDVVLVYERNSISKLITFINAGSHEKIFGK